MPVLFFRARRGSGAAGSTSEAASTSQLGVREYPCMLAGNRLIFSSDDSDFNLADLDAVIISDEAKASGPPTRSGESSLSFKGPIVLESWQDVKLHHSSVSVAGHEVECTDNFDNLEEREVLKNKVRSILNHLPKLISEKNPRFLQVV